MSRRIAILTKSEVRFYDVNTTDRPMTIVGEMLYRTDEKFMLAGKNRPDEFCMYDHNGIYPYNIPSEELSTCDETMAYLDIIKISHRKVAKAKSGSGIVKWIFEKNHLAYVVLGAVAVWYIFNKYM